MRIEEKTETKREGQRGKLGGGCGDRESKKLRPWSRITPP